MRRSVTRTTEYPAFGSSEWYSTLRARSGTALYSAYTAAFGDDERIGQEGFMAAGEILRLARASGLTAGSLALDICSGSGGAALFLAQQIGCRIVGVDTCPQAIRLAGIGARDRRMSHRTRFLMADARWLPISTQFDAAFLFETMLAIDDKRQLFDGISQLLRPGGRFVFTFEEGLPLSCREQHRLMGGDKIWLVTENELIMLLRKSHLRVRQVEDRTEAHARIAIGLVKAFSRYRDAIAAEVGLSLCRDMIKAHAQWAELLSTGRVHKLALVTERINE